MLRLSWIPLSIVLVGVVQVSAAQDATFEARDGHRPPSAQEPDMTAARTQEMLFYERERERYEDPKAAIRRRAELKAQQRAARLASQKWFGVSNSRPIVSCTPACGGSFRPIGGRTLTILTAGAHMHRWSCGRAWSGIKHMAVLAAVAC